MSGFFLFSEQAQGGQGGTSRALLETSSRTEPSGSNARPWSLLMKFTPFTTIALTSLLAVSLTLTAVIFVNHDQSGEATTDSSAEIINRSAASVGLVLVRSTLADGSIVEQPGATAWVVGEGQLGSAAHVAEVFDELGQDDELIVRFPGPDAVTLRISGVLIHPAYGQLEALLHGLDYKRWTAGSVPAADVALLDVAVEDQKRLPSPLPLASQDRLENLRALDELFLIGHPLEGLVATGTHPEAPVPAILRGHLSRLSDHLFAAAEANKARLLHVDLPATGGVSGSPILDRDGYVVGVLSAGNCAQGEYFRIPLAVGVHFGQRIDWLIDLIETPALGQAERWRQAIIRRATR